MKAFKIVPKKDIIPGVVKSENAEEAMIDFATGMDMDMNLYFEAIEITPEEFVELEGTDDGK